MIVVLKLLMVYNICKGIELEAYYKSLEFLEVKAMDRLKLYVGSHLIFILILLGYVLPNAMIVMTLFFVIINITAYLLLLDLMKDASEKLEVEINE